MVKFPNEGKCEGVHEDLIDFLKNRANNTYPEAGQVPPEKATGIGWNSISYWYLRNVNNSTKPIFSYAQLKNKFFKSKTIELW